MQQPQYYRMPDDSLVLANDMQRRICIFNSSEDNVRFNDRILTKIREHCQEHADKSNSVKHYNDQRRATKAKDDIYYGKCGEHIACAVLYKNGGFPPVAPDVKIYRNISDKMYETDLPFGQKVPGYPDCGVKTCTEKTLSFMEKFTGERQMTWTFQLNDINKRSGRDRLFQETGSSEPILFVYCDVALLSSKLVASAPWSKVHPLLKDPVSPKLKGVKKCLYFNDLIEINNQQ